MKFTTPWDDQQKHRVRAQLASTTIEGLATGWFTDHTGRRLMIAIDGEQQSVYLSETAAWTVTILPDPLVLPTEPGTVIAIGDWWLVRLRPYEGAPSAWELLPMHTKDRHDRAESQGVKAQCVYGDEWVLTEAEQEGSFVVIAAPADPIGELA